MHGGNTDRSYYMNTNLVKIGYLNKPTKANTLITEFTTIKLTIMKDNNPTATYVQALHFWPSTKIFKFIL